MSITIREWGKQQEWDKGYKHVAEANEVSYSLVWFLARYLGIAVKKMKRGRKPGSPGNRFPRSRKLPINAELDFTKRDAELARQYNVSRERIRQLRKSAGAPKISKKQQANQ